MWIFTPRYIKHAKLLLKGVQRFLDYKRDVLPEAKLTEISALRDELKTAIKGRNEEKITELRTTINRSCENALPHGGTSEIADNVEVFFVAIVIALGIRAYIAQPFQIPTGSMQPTLNGINCGPLPETGVPSLPGRFAAWLGGRSYIDAVADRDGPLRRREPITERTWDLGIWPPRLSFLTPHTVLNFADGGKIVIKGPKDKVMSELGLGQALTLPSQRYGPSGPDMRETVRYFPDGAPMINIQKGQVLAKGVVDWGDHVLVNKFSYHFRRPERGEVFVFTTKHISGIDVPREQGSQHYIKRLVGVPGDTLEVKTPQLWVNGKPGSEVGIQRVGSAADPYQGYGSIGYLGPERSVKLGDQEFWAMGDNSYNSSDSRYWGHVPQRNIVGPALISYLPFGKHWGLIR